MPTFGEFALFKYPLMGRGAGAAGAPERDTTLLEYVLAALGKTDGTTIRLSFSAYNTAADIDNAVDALGTIPQG